LKIFDAERDKDFTTGQPYRMLSPPMLEPPTTVRAHHPMGRL
jgi:hypothetical protein